MMNEQGRIHFGSEVRRRRESLGMTLARLSKRSGLSSNEIVRVEAGRSEPSLSILLRIAAGLGVMPAELCSSEPEDSPRVDEEADVPEPPESHTRRKLRESPEPPKSHKRPKSREPLGT